MSNFDFRLHFASTLDSGSGRMAEGTEHFVDEVGWQSIVHEGRWGCSELLEERCGGDILRKRWKRGIRHDDASVFAVEAAMSDCLRGAFVELRC